MNLTPATQALVAKTQALLVQHDPLPRVGGERPQDDYREDAEVVYQKLGPCKNRDDVLHILYAEFCQWLGVGARKPEDELGPLADDLWRLRRDDWS